MYSVDQDHKSTYSYTEIRNAIPDYFDRFSSLNICNLCSEYIIVNVFIPVIARVFEIITKMLCTISTKLKQIPIHVH